MLGPSTHHVSTYFKRHWYARKSSKQKLGKERAWYGNIDYINQHQEISHLTKSD